jgi:prepilin-type N-terminal cleavage/methylation domain-containing protein
MIKIKNNQKGFSLTEVLVVVSIMLLIDTMVFLSNRAVNTSRSVEMSAYRLASEIRKMQSYTLNLQSFQNAYPNGGWGIHLRKDSNFFRLYADLGITPDHQEGIGELFQQIELPSRVVVRDIIFDNGASASVNDVHLTFEPPDPSTWIDDGVHDDGQTVTIVLSDDSNTITEEVIVNQFGLIEVQ